MPSDLQYDLLEELSQQQKEKDSSLHQSEEELLKALHFIFYDNLKIIDIALDIVDRGNITCIQSNSCDRCFWRVCSAPNADEYTVFQSYCACRSYAEQCKHAVTGASAATSTVMCKHMLAVRLAVLLNRIGRMSIVSDTVFVEMMCNVSPSKVSYNTRGYERMDDGAGYTNFASSFSSTSHEQRSS